MNESDPESANLIDVGMSPLVKAGYADYLAERDREGKR